MASRGGGNSNQMKWSQPMEKFFLQRVLQKVRSNIPFQTYDWEDIDAEIQQRFDVCWGVNRLKLKLKKDKMAFEKFTALINRTGAGWDPLTRTISADDDFWRPFCQRGSVSMYTGFRKHGLPHYELLEEIFGKTAVTGAVRRASTDLPPTSSKGRGIEQCLRTPRIGRSRAQMNLEEETDSLSNPPGSLMHGEPPLQPGERGKGKKDRMEKIVGVIGKSLRSKTDPSRPSSKRSKSVIIPVKIDEFSNPACLTVLNEMRQEEGVTDRQWLAAMKSFKDPHIREGFIMMPPSVRSLWLNEEAGE
ncbi:hypothetical protein CDL15_Pgr005272 [Punica granatum]|uniref:Myb/SANT-like domain-containing protein n=1 Tax=Punica granatum TaxID=22663 RepID=A0A218XEV5_PUNGR|nr:hypothetical protein CDL15_Pgr005272 [Punica granatum]